MEEDYYDYVKTQLEYQDISNLISISQKLFKNNLISFKHVKITEASVKKLFNIEDKDSIITIIDKVFNKCKDNSLSNYLSDGDISECSSIYITRNNDGFCFEDKSSVADDLTDAIHESAKKVEFIRKEFNLSIKTEDEFNQDL